MFFSLRFQSQLRRTRPKLLRQLEKSIVETIQNFSGEVKVEYKLIGASFDDTGIGFIIDMLCVLESMEKALEKASSELYGHICVLGRDTDEEDVAVLARGLPSDLWGTGIWCDPELRGLLEPFVEFDDPLAPPDYQKPFSGYAQVKKIRESPAGSGEEERSRDDSSEKINQYLKQGAWRNTAIVGAEFIGKREGLYRFCAGTMGNFPPLVIRFGCGNAVACIADALSPDIKQILASADAEKLETADPFFQERFREEISGFLVKQGETFFYALVEAYMAAASRAKVHPVVVLENLQAADSPARRIVSGVCLQIGSRDGLYFYATCTDMKALKPWEEVFPRIIKFSPEKKNRPSLPDIPPDLWEMAYACALFCRFFPGYLVPRFFAEEGKNPAMIEKTLALLSALRLTGGPADPSPQFPNLLSLAETILGERAERIRKIVRNRLMAWVDSGRITPCFGLLKALSVLGGEGSEALMIDAVYGDVINGTYGGIEKAIGDGSLASVAGESCAAPLTSLFRAQKALSYGSREEIVKTFAEPFSVNSLHPDFQARILASQASYSLSVCDVDAAAALVKEAMLIAQKENAGRDLAHIYRLFSLVNFSNRQLSDAIDYFTFAAEAAEKTAAELALISYYSASAHFIFGNISKAERLSRKAEEAALAAGWPDWADRCWFLRGRLHFEVGRYQEALDIFKSLETGHYGSAPEGFAQTVAAWLYRSSVYLHNTAYRSGGKISESGECYDGRLFRLEDAYLSGDYQKTLELALGRNDTLTGDRFLYIEQPDWRSGFAQCELLLFPLKDIWDRMFLTYRALALCHLAGGEHGEKEEAIREMRRVMRDELPDTDPNDAFYFYSYYRVLKRSGAPEVDMNTAISLAFKRLQRRASRIDDNQTKRSFLSFHYWNGALEVAAKEHKLI
jgi:tetratricopeptide (TPR) repeat protein